MRRAALLGVALWAGPAAAQDASVRLNDALRLEWRGDNGNRRADDDDYGVVVNKLDIAGSAGDLTAEARVDAVEVVGEPTADFQDDARLERLTVRYPLGDLKLTAGDFYRQIGRGVALSLRKVDDLGVDVALRGGRLEYGAGDWQADAFVGRTNSVNLDPVSQHFTADPEDVVVGATARVARLGPAAISAWAVQITNEHRPVADQEFADRSNTVGGALELTDLFEAVTVYAEYDLQQVRDTDAVNRAQAAYASLDIYLGEWSVLAEGLWLDDFRQQGSPNAALGSDFDYNQPPTLERIDQEVLNTTHALGGRLRVERSLLDGDLVAHANGLFKHTDPGACARVAQLHGFAGVELLFQAGSSRLNASGGYRDERADPVASACVGAVPEARRIKSMAHGELDYVQHLTGAWSLHLTSLNEVRTLDDTDYLRGSTLVGVDVAQTGALTLEYGFDTQNQAPGVRNHFFAGIAAWHAQSWLQARAVIGTQRGGIKCVAGICRDFPEFAGARLELIGRHDLGG